MDRWLVNPRTLQTYRVPGDATLAPGPVRLVGLDGQAETVDPAGLGRYEADPGEAARELGAWLRGPRGRVALADELGGPLTPLLTARTPEAFVAALSELTGERDPERLNGALNALEERAREMRARLNAGQGPPLLRPEGGETVPPDSPALLALVAVVRAGQAETLTAETPTVDAPPEPVPTPLPVAPPRMPDLDFSLEAVRARLERSRSRKGGR